MTSRNSRLNQHYLAATWTHFPPTWTLFATRPHSGFKSSLLFEYNLPSWQPIPDKTIESGTPKTPNQPTLSGIVMTNDVPWFWQIHQPPPEDFVLCRAISFPRVFNLIYKWFSIRVPRRNSSGYIFFYFSRHPFEGLLRSLGRNNF